MNSDKLQPGKYILVKLDGDKFKIWKLGKDVVSYIKSRVANNMTKPLVILLVSDNKEDCKFERKILEANIKFEARLKKRREELNNLVIFDDNGSFD